MTESDRWFATRAAGTSSRVIIVSTAGEWADAFESLMMDILDFPFIGIDCEWLANDSVAEQARVEAANYPILLDNIENRRVCLLQLATKQGTCVLVRLCLFDQLPSGLIRLLTHGNVWKVGVNTEADRKQLFRKWTVELASWLDLRNVFKDCEGVGLLPPHKSAQELGLNGLSERLFGRVACDNKSTIARSNWAAVELSAEQTTYAAGDAQMGIDCFVAMCNTVWPDARGELRIADIWNRFEAHKCRPIASTTGKVKQRRGEKTADTAASEVGAVKQAPRDRMTEKAKKIPQLRRNKLYDNIQLFAPDGALVGLIGRKKAAWYLTKGLAVEKASSGADQLAKSNPSVDVARDAKPPSPSPSSAMPTALYLLRDPHGRPHGSELYYIQVKENRCVVCGAQECLVRKNIVPHEYRRCFPSEHKNHHSHDVVLLCAECHARTDNVDAKLRRSLADRFDAPLTTSRVAVDRSLHEVAKAAKALLSAADRLPPERKLSLQKVVRKHLQIDDDAPLEREHLLRATTVDYRSENDAFSSHAEVVVERICRDTDQGPHELERMWRDHFLTHMKPRFLPPMWSRDHIKPEEKL